MLRSPYLYESRLFKHKVNAALFGVGKKKKDNKGNKKGLINTKFDESLEGCTLLKIGPSGP
jgi:hypothetical protein